MPFYLHHFFAFLISAGVVLLTTPVVRRLGLQSGQVDMPGGRKVHQKPMVRLGEYPFFWVPS
jgi:UDP-GlcNAc:undecaprenyl-phosphate GlcNAc-1-phosphate transferase